MDNAGMKIPSNLAPKMPMRSDKDIYTGQPGCQDDGFYKTSGKPVRCVECNCRRFVKTVTKRITKCTIENFPNGIVGCAIAHDIHCIQCETLAAHEELGAYERPIF